MTATTSKMHYKAPPRTAKEVFEMVPENTLAEVINNTIYIAPSPDFFHQKTSIKLASLMYLFAEEKNLGDFIAAPADVYLDEKNIVQPDILFISRVNSGIIVNGKIKGIPDLIIEILSADRKYDVQTKKALYETFGVKEYFIVDPNTKEVITWYHDGEKYLQQESRPGKIKSRLLKKVFSF